MDKAYANECAFISEKLIQDTKLGFTIASLMRQGNIHEALQGVAAKFKKEQKARLNTTCKEWKAIPPPVVKRILAELEPEIFTVEFIRGKADHWLHSVMCWALGVNRLAKMCFEAYPQFVCIAKLVVLSVVRYQALGRRLQHFGDQQQQQHGYFKLDSTDADNLRAIYTLGQNQSIPWPFGSAGAGEVFLGTTPSPWKQC